MGGISIFVKYAGVSFSNEDQFDIIRSYIIDTHFSDIYNLVDKKTEDISQIWFISYDPAVFYNYDNVISFTKEILKLSGPPYRPKTTASGGIFKLERRLFEALGRLMG